MSKLVILVKNYFTCYRIQCLCFLKKQVAEINTGNINIELQSYKLQSKLSFT